MHTAEAKRLWGLVVYADDFVACFQYKEEAEEFYKHLKNRMEHFGMTLEENKSSLMEFGRYAEEQCKREGRKPGTFTFLGFTYYCSHGRNGKFRVKNQQEEIYEEMQRSPSANTGYENDTHKSHNKEAE